MKRLTSIFLVFAMLLTLAPMNIFAAENDKTVFSDVKTTDYYAKAATALEELGIISGYPDGTYGAEKSITRAEMAAIVCRIIDKEADAEKAKGKTIFDDVSSDHWASGYINIAVTEGIINGDGNGKFRPEDEVKYEEAIKMIVCALGYADDIETNPADWSKAYLDIADDKGITSDLKGKKGEPATRGDIAVMSFNGLSVDLAAPTTSLEAGSYRGTKSVKLSTTTEGADIYYTTDGSTPTVKSTKYTKAISISKNCTLKAITVKDGVLVSDVLSVDYKIKRSSGGGGSSNPATYTVSFDLNYEGATGAPANQSIKEGDKALRPENPTRVGFQFVGWFLDKNESDWKNTFDFKNTNIESNISLFALWVDITIDTDEDDLSDELEKYIGTDMTKIDSDGDGLTDYQEVVIIGTDPLKIDTDNNGISDYNEDNDNDTLSNGYECSIGTDPINKDSDNDLLDDNEEINIYHTSPINADTDGDGASDGWEINNNFNPNVANISFDVYQSSESVSEANPVAASVDVELNGLQVNTLTITPVSVADNPFVSTSIPGYLGNAYDFSVDGDITAATLTFEYDSSMGTISEYFQPRIYYFNESSKEFEEIDNQVVENGKVIATTSHFSTYILLNKVDFDKVWNEEIKKPITDDSGATFKSIDVAFAIDVSGSMDGSRISTAKSALNTFIDALSASDRAGLIKFNSSATTLINLTDNKDNVKNCVSSLYTGGMTSMYNGFENALSLLTSPDEEYGYKIIIILSDGLDEPSTNYQSYYQELVNTAVENNIVVYTIGVGSNVDTSILTKIAENTNGAYYHATSSSEITDIFLDLQKDTVDLTTDTNNDGIPDYYTELIKNGNLVLSNGSNEFKGIDFNYNINGEVSDDYDGDGLKNGEELKVIQKGDKVYLVMKSNPMMVHSDRDGIDDKTEVSNGTDPLVYQIYNGNAKKLYSDDYYYYASAVDQFDQDWLWKADTAFLAGVFGIWNKDELYRDIMIDYFANYADNSYVEGLETEQTRKTMIETLSALISNIKTYGTAPYSEIKKITQLISEINGTSDTKTIHYLLFSIYKEIVEEVIEINPKLGEIKITTYQMKSQTLILINLNAINDKVGKACKVISYISYGLDIADTIASFSKVSANAEAFENNIDILQEIKDNSSDDHAKDAASAIMNKLAGSYGDEVLALGGDVLEIAGKELISALSKANVYVLAVVAVRDGIDIITGISKDLKQHYQMICYDRMTTAIESLFDNIVTNKGNYYYVSDDNIENLNRYLINLAQLRILGEKKYCEWQEDEGMIGWFTDNSDVEKKINEKISAIKGLINSLGLQISTKL